MESYIFHIGIIICINFILAGSLQLSLGYGGVLNLGHLSIFGIGAYAYALSSHCNISFLFSIFIAIIISAITGFILSLLISSLKDEYLALATLGFSFIVYAILLNWTALTNGPLGLAGIPKPTIVGIEFYDDFQFFLLVFIISIIVYIFLNQIYKSQYGKTLEAIRDNELSAKSIGIDTKKFKITSLVISSVFTGLSGALFASYYAYINPSSFTFMGLIPILLILVIGGLTSLKGIILATVIISILPEPLRFINFPLSIIGSIRNIIYTILLIIVIYNNPQGLYKK